MKNIFVSIVLMFSTFLLSSCFEDKDVVNDAKKELGIKQDVDETSDKGDKVVENDSELEETLVKEDEFKQFEIESLSMNTFIELDDLSMKDFTSGEIEITGKTLLEVDKIRVTFLNETSEFPEDDYLLKQFKSGDDTFLYRAFSRYQTLDYGKNEYIFTAFSGDETSKIKLIINLKTPEELKGENNNEGEEDSKKVVNKNISYEKQELGSGDDKVYLNFPKSELFGEMISTGKDSFTYSNIDGLSVTKKLVSDIKCDNITDILSENINSWFYWNTCRDIIKDKGIKFNVLRLSGDEYFYERHYADYNNSLYGTFLIEKGTGVTSENIKEKNSILKEKEFAKIEVVDELFYEIVR